METRHLPSYTFMTTAHPTLVRYREPYPALEAVQHTAVGKYILITNASHGIGRFIAISWARAGVAGLAISTLNAEDLTSVAAEIRLINPAIPLVAMICDTTNSFDVTKLFSAIRDVFGRLDVLITNVGTSHLGNLDETDDNDMWWTDVTTNFRTTHLTAHQYIRTFGPSPPGTFISITSGADSCVEPGVSSHEFAQQIDCRLRAFLTTEYPTMKAFSLDPGPIPMGRGRRAHNRFEMHKSELVGLFSIWLGGGRADVLRGSYMCAGWDIRELELDIQQSLKRNNLKQTLSSSCLRLDMRQK